MLTQNFATHLTPLKVILCAAVLSLTSPLLFADEYLISDDGRQILIKDDGTWVQVSKDRYATTKNGQRIRLQPNGNWDVVKKMSGDAASTYSPSQSNPSEHTLAQDDVRILLDKVEILKKKTKVLKSVRIDTRTVFHLSVTNQGTKNLDLSAISRNAFTAKSSGKETFDILSVTPQATQLKPNEHTVVVVISDGSPKWFGVKYLNIEISEQALGNNTPHILSKNIDDVIQRTVDQL